MVSISLGCILLILLILRLRQKLNDFYTKTRLCLLQHIATSQTAGKQASGLLCTLPFWTSIAPCVGGPVRVEAPQKLCSSGLFSDEGVGKAEFRAAFFPFFLI